MIGRKAAEVRFSIGRYPFSRGIMSHRRLRRENRDLPIVQSDLPSSAIKFFGSPAGSPSELQQR